MKQKVSIIILNWNGWQDTIECLESLYKIDYPNYDVIIVDNGSQDNSVEMIKNYALGDLLIESDFFEFEKCNKPINIFEYESKTLKSLSIIDRKYHNLDSNKRLILIKNNHNSGFSEGNNIGINFALKILQPKYFLLLNNDTIVHNNFLDELVKFANKSPKIGIVGPKVLYYNKPKKTAFMGNNVNLCNGRIFHVFKKNESSSTPVKIGFVYGCGLLIKRNVLDDIGLLDPNYFLYYEDVDWCLRARRKGYDVFYVPKSMIWHKIPLKGSISLNSYYYGNRNSFLLIKKNRSSIKFVSCYIRLFINKFMLSVYLLIKGNRKASFAVIKAVYDGSMGIYGYKKLD
jgi:GT2 family glycosyltransferase